MQITGYILFVIHLILLLWAAGGIIEMITPEVMWKPYTNPEFPGWVLVIHWGSVLFASVIFLYGYLTHWSRTPYVMIIAYGLMSLVCLIETFGFMTGKSKYLLMAIEFTAYIAILLLLFKTNYFRSRFRLDV